MQILTPIYTMRTLRHEWHTPGEWDVRLHVADHDAMRQIDYRCHPIHARSSVARYSDTLHALLLAGV